MTSSAATTSSPAQDEDPRLALDDRVRVGAVVLAEGVAGRLDDDPEGVEAGARLGLTRKTTRFAPALRSSRWVATSVPSMNSRTVAGWATLEVTSTIASIVLAEAGGRWRREPLDEHLVAVDEADDPRLDLDAPRGREGRLALAAAGRVVAVRDEDDPLLGRVGEERGGEAERRADVRGGLDRRAAQPVDRAELLGQPLDERVLAERDDARLVALGHHVERLAQEGERVLAARSLPTLSERSTTKTVASRSTGSTSWKPASAKTSADRRTRPEGDRGAAPAGAHPPARGEVRDERQERAPG